MGGKAAMRGRSVAWVCMSAHEHTSNTASQRIAQTKKNWYPALTFFIFYPACLQPYSVPTMSAQTPSQPSL